MLILEPGERGRVAPPTGGAANANAVALEVHQLEQQVEAIRVQLAARESNVHQFRETSRALQEFKSKMDHQSRVLADLSAALKPAPSAGPTSAAMRPSNTVQRPSAPLGTQAQKCPPLGLGEEDLREAARLGLDEHDLEGLMEELAMKEFQHLEKMLEQIHVDSSSSEPADRQAAIDRWIDQEAEKWVRSQLGEQSSTPMSAPSAAADPLADSSPPMDEQIFEAADMWKQGIGREPSEKPCTPPRGAAWRGAGGTAVVHSEEKPNLSHLSTEDRQAAEMYLKARRELTKMRQELARVKHEASRKNASNAAGRTKHDPSADELDRARQEARIEAEVEKRARLLAEAEGRARREAAAREEVERSARQRANAKAVEEAERRVRAEIKAREEAEARERMQHERMSRDNASQQVAREKAERRARELADRREQHSREQAELRLEAERLARAEAERRVLVKARKLAREEAERRAREHVANRTRELAEMRARRAREQAELRAEVERQAREDIERKVRVQMERVAREHAKRAAQQKTEIKQKQKAQQERAEKEHLRILQEAERQQEEKRAIEAAERRKHEKIRSREIRLREEAERRAELERRAREDAESKVKELEMLRARDDAERALAAVETKRERKAREAAERRAQTEQRKREEVEAELTMMKSTSNFGSHSRAGSTYRSVSGMIPDPATVAQLGAPGAASHGKQQQQKEKDKAVDAEMLRSSYYVRRLKDLAARELLREVEPLLKQVEDASSPKRPRESQVLVATDVAESDAKNDTEQQSTDATLEEQSTGCSTIQSDAPPAPAPKPIAESSESSRATPLKPAVPLTQEEAVKTSPPSSEPTEAAQEVDVQAAESLTAAVSTATPAASGVHDPEIPTHHGKSSDTENAKLQQLLLLREQLLKNPYYIGHLSKLATSELRQRMAKVQTEDPAETAAVSLEEMKAKVAEVRAQIAAAGAEVTKVASSAGMEVPHGLQVALRDRTPQPASSSDPADQVVEELVVDIFAQVELDLFPVFPATTSTSTAAGRLAHPSTMLQRDAEQLTAPRARIRGKMFEKPWQTEMLVGEPVRFQVQSGSRYGSGDAPISRNVTAARRKPRRQPQLNASRPPARLPRVAGKSKPPGMPGHAGVPLRTVPGRRSPARVTHAKRRSVDGSRLAPLRKSPHDKRGRRRDEGSVRQTMSDTQVSWGQFSFQGEEDEFARALGIVDRGGDGDRPGSTDPNLNGGELVGWTKPKQSQHHDGHEEANGRNWKAEQEKGWVESSSNEAIRLAGEAYLKQPLPPSLLRAYGGSSAARRKAPARRSAR